MKFKDYLTEEDPDDIVQFNAKGYRAAHGKDPKDSARGRWTFEYKNKKYTSKNMSLEKAKTWVLNELYKEYGPLKRLYPTINILG